MSFKLDLDRVKVNLYGSYLG